MTPRMTPSDNSSAAPDGWGSAPSRAGPPGWTSISKESAGSEDILAHGSEGSWLGSSWKASWLMSEGSWLMQNSGLRQGRLSASRTSEARSKMHNFSVDLLTKWVFVNRRGICSYRYKQLTQGRIVSKSAIFIRNKKYIYN